MHTETIVCVCVCVLSFYKMFKSYHKCIFVNPLLSRNPKRSTQANSADPDQMLHHAASDQGLHCLLTAIFL